MILVTGATGNIGSELVTQLLAKDRPLRVVTRDERKVAHLGSHVERVVGSLKDRATAAQAVRGAEKLFLVSVLDEDGSTDRVLLEEAVRAGVRHVVKVSALGVGATTGNGIGQHHRQGERDVVASGLPWTFLRPGMFMSNALQWADTIRARATVYSPTGQGLAAPISPRDIAAVAAVALTGAGHEGQAYDLTGPELLSAHDQVRILSQVLGRPLTCVDVPPEAAAEGMRKSGAPGWLVEAVTSLWQSMRSGGAAVRTEEVARLTGSPAQTFEQWCEEHRAAFL